jgi:hypothetical protein
MADSSARTVIPYRGFVAFSDWLVGCEVNVERYESNPRRRHWQSCARAIPRGSPGHWKS